MSSVFRHLPLQNAQPDAQGFVSVILGRARGERPPLVEYLVDDALRRPITENLLDRQWVDPVPGDRPSMEAYLDNFVAF